ncbi:hypothetical protein CEUSTIGMA_g10391.t1 [Chlamydomonas eustigma]|uniref:Uncharacterized protein n=1 Tax=Chlamydomonas eustigma TaxID=1157962 RepID=A0A250XIQ7_9CHLO|nr:hypothetical protein CEUSTIGMA_g10391.t1 [Chlamydomonas eustigma]|eukprot:GAX82964.1 hypothetical protein CEUSTIGMA_g10391.t1 [Chlamydomonas eustigma]
MIKHHLLFPQNKNPTGGEGVQGTMRPGDLCDVLRAVWGLHGSDVRFWDFGAGGGHVVIVALLVFFFDARGCDLTQSKCTVANQCAKLAATHVLGSEEAAGNMLSSPLVYEAMVGKRSAKALLNVLESTRVNVYFVFWAGWCAEDKAALIRIFLCSSQAKTLVRGDYTNRRMLDEEEKAVAELERRCTIVHRLGIKTTGGSNSFTCWIYTKKNDCSPLDLPSCWDHHQPACHSDKEDSIEDINGSGSEEKNEALLLAEDEVAHASSEKAVEKALALEQLNCCMKEETTIAVHSPLLKLAAADGRLMASSITILNAAKGTSTSKDRCSLLQDAKKDGGRGVGGVKQLSTEMISEAVQKQQKSDMRCLSNPSSRRDPFLYKATGGQNVGQCVIEGDEQQQVVLNADWDPQDMSEQSPDDSQPCSASEESRSDEESEGRSRGFTDDDKDVDPEGYQKRIGRQGSRMLDRHCGSMIHDDDDECDVVPGTEDDDSAEEDEEPHNMITRKEASTKEWVPHVGAAVAVLDGDVVEGTRLQVANRSHGKHHAIHHVQKETEVLETADQVKSGWRKADVQKGGEVQQPAQSTAAAQYGGKDKETGGQKHVEIEDQAGMDQAASRKGDQSNHGSKEAAFTSAAGTLANPAGSTSEAGRGSQHEGTSSSKLHSSDEQPLPMLTQQTDIKERQVHDFEEPARSLGGDDEVKRLQSLGVPHQPSHFIMGPLPCIQSPLNTHADVQPACNSVDDVIFSRNKTWRPSSHAHSSGDHDHSGYGAGSPLVGRLPIIEAPVACQQPSSQEAEMKVMVAHEAGVEGIVQDQAAAASEAAAVAAAAATAEADNDHDATPLYHQTQVSWRDSLLLKARTCKERVQGFIKLAEAGQVLPPEHLQEILDVLSSVEEGRVRERKRRRLQMKNTIYVGERDQGVAADGECEETFGRNRPQLIDHMTCLRNSSADDAVAPPAPSPQEQMGKTAACCGSQAKLLSAHPPFPPPCSGSQALNPPFPPPCSCGTPLLLKYTVRISNMMTHQELRPQVPMAQPATQLGQQAGVAGGINNDACGEGQQNGERSQVQQQQYDDDDKAVQDTQLKLHEMRKPQPCVVQGEIPTHGGHLQLLMSDRYIANAQQRTKATEPFNKRKGLHSCSMELGEEETDSESSFICE